MEEQKELEDAHEEEVELRVAGSTGTKELAAAITSHLRAGKRVTLVTIGHQAIGQATKSIPVVNSYLMSKGIMFTILPCFEDRQIKGKDGGDIPRTVVLLKLVRYVFR